MKRILIIWGSMVKSRIRISLFSRNTLFILYNFSVHVLVVKVVPIKWIYIMGNIKKQ